MKIVKHELFTSVCQIILALLGINMILKRNDIVLGLALTSVSLLFTEIIKVLSKY